MNELILLADIDGKAWNFTSRIRDYIEEEHGHKYAPRLIAIKNRKFADGDIKPKITENIRKKNCFFVHDSSLSTPEWFYQLDLIGYTLKYSSANESTIVLPYFRPGRQDRKDESRVPINAKVTADMICKYADRCIICDPHFKQIQGFFNIPTDVLYTFPTVVKYFKKFHKDYLKNAQLISTDAGAYERTASFGKKANMDLDSIIVGKKIRDPEKPNESKFKIDGKKVKEYALAIEDILDTGGTAIKTAKGLREKGFKKIGISATHLLNNLGCLKKLEEVYDLVVVCDTLYPPESKGVLEVLSLIPLFGDAIWNINRGESISRLFE